MIESLIWVVVNGITCSVNDSTGAITSKNKNKPLLYSQYYAQVCNKFVGPFAATLSLGNTVPFEEKSQQWLWVWFDQPKIWTRDLLHQSRTDNA